MTFLCYSDNGAVMKSIQIMFTLYLYFCIIPNVISFYKFISNYTQNGRSCKMKANRNTTADDTENNFSRLFTQKSLYKADDT